MHFLKWINQLFFIILLFLLQQFFKCGALVIGLWSLKFKVQIPTKLRFKFVNAATQEKNRDLVCFSHPAASSI